MKKSMHTAFLRRHLISVSKAFMKIKPKDRLEPYLFSNNTSLLEQRKPRTTGPRQAGACITNVTASSEAEPSKALAGSQPRAHGPHLCWWQRSAPSAIKATLVSASNNRGWQLWWLISVPLLLWTNANNAAWYRSQIKHGYWKRNYINYFLKLSSKELLLCRKFFFSTAQGICLAFCSSDRFFVN